MTKGNQIHMNALPVRRFWAFGLSSTLCPNQEVQKSTPGNQSGWRELGEQRNKKSLLPFGRFPKLLQDQGERLNSEWSSEIQWLHWPGPIHHWAEAVLRGSSVWSSFSYLRGNWEAVQSAWSSDSVKEWPGPIGQVGQGICGGKWSCFVITAFESW